MKVKLEKIYLKERMSAKTGKPFISMSIKTSEHGDKWLSGFKGAENAHWNEGDVVDIIVEQKGEYLNFSVPKVNQAGRLEELEKRIDALEKQVASFGNNYELTADGEEIPF